MRIPHFKKWNQPWVYFLVFFISNGLIAYEFSGLEEKLFIAFYGILLPFGFYLFFQFRNFSPQTSSKTNLFLSQEDGFSIKPTVFLAIMMSLILLATRFYKLESVPFWPSKDDGHFGILGMALSRKWSWQLLWGECQNQPLILWMLAFYFKWIEPSLFSLRLFSAFLSVGTALLGYWAARQFFSKKHSLVLTFFLTFNFWALISSRLCVGAITVIPLEYAVFGALGRCLKNFKISNHFRYLDTLILGIASGVGFYTYAVWPVIFLSVLIVVIFQVWKYPQNKTALFIYGLSGFLTAFPMLLTELSQNGMAHLHDEFLRQPILGSIANYFQMFFWKGGFCFNGPVWGGIFNPLEDGLIFLGVALLVVDIKKSYSQWIFLTGFFFLLPGILSNAVEICHVVQLIPLCCLIAALGFQRIVNGFSSALYWKSTLALFLVILTLNLYHWLGPFQQWNSIPVQQSDWVPIEYFEAYQLIKEKSRESGPGNVFSEFTLDNYNKTLNVACYPVDTLQNPKLIQMNPGWSALLVDKYYIPFLKNRFPRSQWIGLKKDDTRYHSDLVLGLIPTDSMKPEELTVWKKTDAVFRDLNLKLKAQTSPIPWMEFKNILLNSSKILEKDRFLSAIFWEKIALIDSNRLAYDDVVRDFKKSIDDGYPAANLYYNLELALKMTGHEKEANQILQKALQAQQKFISFEPAL